MSRERGQPLTRDKLKIVQEGQVTVIRYQKSMGRGLGLQRDHNKSIKGGICAMLGPDPSASLARIPPEDDEANADESWKLPLHLMTALRAKGKEFDAVIVLDANDGIWPSKLAKTEEELEQERRLFYVAMTRARKYLYFLVDDTILGESATASPYLAEMGLNVT